MKASATGFDLAAPDYERDIVIESSRLHETRCSAISGSREDEFVSCMACRQCVRMNGQVLGLVQSVYVGQSALATTSQVALCPPAPTLHPHPSL